MDFFSGLACYLAILLNIYTFIKCYEYMSNKKVLINKNYVISFIIVSIVTYYGNTNISTFLRTIISFFSIFLCYKIIFNESLFITFLKTFTIFVILLILDFISSTIFLLFPIKSFIDLGAISILRALSTVLVSLLMLLLFLIKGYRNFINKLLNYIVNKFKATYIAIGLIICIIFYILSYLNAINFSQETYLFLISLIVFFLFLCIIVFVQYINNKHSEEEQEALLKLMNEYENMLEKDRINRHEMLNNLIVIKSFKDKNSKEYEETLNEIIKSYEDKKSKTYTNLYKLPSGIKGVIYYRIWKIKENNINLNLLCSSDVDKYFDGLEEKLYYKVCKIVGIVLDNAIEAASLTENKILLIDIYEEESLKIYIENTFKNNIDINAIYEKGFSSKGENRGYGLYIVNKILKETDNIKFNQSIENNRFITEITIKKF